MNGSDYFALCSSPQAKVAWFERTIEIECEHDVTVPFTICPFYLFLAIFSKK